MDIENVSVTFRQRQSFFRHRKHDVLENVSFEVFAGETLGVIGRNGCGKSTLLKILAGILTPNTGQVIKDASLKVSLQTLAAGFDPELSGRDNAILASMLLGHKKSDAIKNMVQINEFAGLNDSFHDPVKTYSSGMRSRLGFSTAITMHADILLVDEVLGVGDAGFRKRAEAAIKSKINSNQTVVFVSHSIGQIKMLCDRVVWLEAGAVREIGETERVANNYTKFIENIKDKS
ncbi:MAG: ABC transporter ATP-binding protein [Cyanobacteria bacterium P01_F01_bin.86]